MRKVKFTQQSFHDRLSLIISEFPKIEEIHPFFADLLNVLYDKDHYKLALGQINTARHLIDNVARDYTKLIKFGDSLYRCKQLKIAALGRMAKIMKRQSDSLSYLEQVRQHLSRLPSIDPTAKTILLCGFPNVGKSSFLNKITRADVDVQPYPFTTKSLYVGHTEYKYQNWQVIDTPGILDRPLEERNTIEMQSITALAHLRSVVIYMIDLSEQCGYTIEKQLELYSSIKPLFSKKPVFIVNNKIDVICLDKLAEDRKEFVTQFLSHEAQSNVQFHQMSTITTENVVQIRNEVCEVMLSRLGTTSSKGTVKAYDELHVSKPDHVDQHRQPYIPPKIIERRAKGLKAIGEGEKTERDIEIELGDDYILDLKKKYDIPDEEKYDKPAELWQGHNIADFVDPGITKLLHQLEEEEKDRERSGYYDISSDESEGISDVRVLASEIREKKALLKAQRRLDHTTKPRLSRPQKRGRENTVDGLKSNMSDLGVDLSDDVEYHFDTAAERSATREAKRQKLTSVARDRSCSEISRSESCMRDPKMIQKARRLKQKSQATRRTLARKGEADRSIPNLRAKHLLSGKRKLGKTSRR